VDLTYPPEVEGFRSELRTWLETNLTDRYRGLSGVMLDPSADDLVAYREWLAALADAGYAAMSWPAEYGGRDAGVLEQVVLAEEMDRAGAPGHLNALGMSNIAPAIIAYGSDEQKRELLPRMMRGDDIWCQGFSEPGAGSDLASLRTTAVLDGDHYVVDGQKVWTTLGHVATHCELLVRTDPDAQKHRGISCLLVDMSLPGVEVRPLVTMTGEPEFNEIFFTGVRVPVSARLGPANDGWRVAMTTLNHERGGVVSLHLGVRRRIRRLLDLARETGAAADPVARQKLAQVYLEGELLKMLADRVIAGEASGRGAGPEAALGKLVWSDVETHLAEAAVAVLGPDAGGGEWGRTRVYARALSIAGGTTQINRQVVATQVLGLPKP
jgi:alkylation response protein AidB-like acyl-CoA dehydrogenase